MSQEKYPGQFEDIVALFGGENSRIEVLDPNPATPAELEAERVARASRPEPIVKHEDPTAIIERKLLERFRNGMVDPSPHVPSEFVDLETSVAKIAGQEFPISQDAYRAIGKIVLREYRRHNMSHIREVQDGFLSALRPSKSRRRRSMRASSPNSKRRTAKVARKASTRKVQAVRKEGPSGLSDVSTVSSAQTNSKLTE